MKKLTYRATAISFLALCAINSSCGGGGSGTTTNPISTASVTSGGNSAGTSQSTPSNTLSSGSSNTLPTNASNNSVNTVVTTAPTCASFATGSYELLDPIGAAPSQSASRILFNAAALTTTSSSGTTSQVTQWTADATPCSFSAPNGLSLIVSQSGLGVMRMGSGTARALVMIPVQAFSLNEFTGKFNYVSFDKVGGGTTYSTLSGFIEFSPAGAVANNEICQYSTHDVCNPSYGAITRLTVNSAGGFDWTDSAGSVFRAFGFKGTDGTSVLLAVRLNAGGILVATPPRALTLPAPNSISSEKTIRIEEGGAAGALLSRRYTTTAVSSTGGVTTYTRQRQSDGVFETLSVNLLAPGYLSIRPKFDSSPSDYGLIGLDMPGLGFGASVDTLNNALTFSIAQ
jgi:hypothetical protein